MKQKLNAVIFGAALFFFGAPAFSGAASAVLPNDLQIFQIQIHAYFHERGYKTFKQFSNNDLREIAEDGFNTIWILGAWQKSPLSEKIQRARKDLPEHGRRIASAYAIYDYQIDSDLGGEKAFRDFVARAKKYDLRIILDITPNSLAADSPWVLRNPEWFIHKKEPPLPDRTEKHSKIQSAHSPSPLWIRFPEWGSAVIPDLAQADLLSPGYWIFLQQAFERTADLTEGGGARIDYLTDFYPSEYHAKWCPQMSFQEFEEKLKIVSENVFGRSPAQGGMILSVLLEGLKKKFPNFMTLGEVYRGQELEWQRAGVDLTYAKYTYDWLVNKRGIARDFAKGPKGAHGHYLTLYAGRSKAWKNFSDYLFRKGRHRVFPPEYFFRSAYFLESHDESIRAVNALDANPFAEEEPFLAWVYEVFRLRHSPAKRARLLAAEARLIFAAMSTTPGVPIVYMGQNRGLNKEAPSAVWIGNDNEVEDEAVRRFYKKLLNQTRRPIFRRGRIIKVSVLRGGARDVLVFARRLGQETAVVALNYSEREKVVTLNLKESGIASENKKVELPPFGVWINGELLVV